MVALSCILILAGCATYKPQPIEPAATATRLETRSLNDPGLRTFLEAHLQTAPLEWPVRSWNLEMLTLAGFYYHPSLEVARAQWAVAEAGKITAGERPNPTIGVAPAYDTTTTVPSPWIVTATLDVPIETAGKRGYRIARAKHLSEAARLNIASVAWQVRSQVRRSLLDLDAAREAEALLQKQQTLEAENVRLLGLQLQAGAISAFELTQARLEADQARLALRDVERNRNEARVQLAEAIGVPARALDGMEFSFDAFSRLSGDVPVDEARRQALLNRADLLSALAEYAASQSALQLEIAKQYPDVHLGPGYEYDQGDNKWSLGLSITLPVLSQNQGGIAEARARREEAAAKFNALQARVLSEIDLAVTGYRMAMEKQKDAQTMLGDRQQQEKTARAMWDAGEISKSELTARQLELSASALAQLDAQVKVQQAAGQLEDALQRPLDWPASLWQNPPRLSESNAAKDHP